MDCGCTSRRAIIPRAHTEAITEPQYFNAHAFATLRAICRRVIPQAAHHAEIDMAGVVDERLAHRMSNGWRYALMPADGDAYRWAFAALDACAIETRRKRFIELDGEAQDQLLQSVQRDELRCGPWRGVSARFFFEELLAEVSELYFSHPLAQEAIGYVGMADAKGWTRIGLNQLEPFEPIPTTEAARA